MEPWKLMRAAGVVAGAAGLAGLLVDGGFIAVKLPLAALAVGGWAVFTAADRQSKDAEARQQLIRMLNHHRHDWMNELQVLFGYVRLKKYDNLPDYMDKIKTKAQHDGLLSKLGIPALIVYFLDRRVENGPCPVEVELEEEIDLRRLTANGDRVYKLIRGIADCILETAALLPGESHMLSIGFEREGGELLVDFVYTGPGDMDLIRSRVGSVMKRWANGLEIREEEYGVEQAEIALALPFRNEA